ncbi:unnamed protein product, partial [Staurois parvus]
TQCRKPTFHAHFLHRIQNALGVRSAQGVNVYLTTPQMQIANTVGLPALDCMVLQYYSILLQYILVHALLLVRSSRCGLTIWKLRHCPRARGQ